MLLNSAMRMFSANGCRSACVNLSTSALYKYRLGHLQSLFVGFDEQDALNGDGGVGIYNVIFRCKVLYKKWKNGNELVFGELMVCVRFDHGRENTHLITKGMQKLDGIDSEDWIDRARSSLKI